MIYKITLICLLLFVTLVIITRLYASSSLNTIDKMLISMGKCPNKTVEVLSLALGITGFISLVMIFISAVVFIISI